MPELLLELLSEEIPARMQARAAEDLKRLVTDKLTEAGLAFEHADAYVTPRRLTLVVDGLPERQPDVTEERRGPRADAPEKAVQGFLGSVGLTRDQLETRETPKGVFYFAVIEKKGRATAEVLADLLPEAIARLPWPKSMRWGEGRERWVRPLHRILGMFAGAAVPFSLGNVAAGTLTEGHRFLAPEPFAVRDFADYRKRLRKAKVILDAAERGEVIAREAAKKAEAEGLSVKPDPALISENAGLVEWPVVLMGGIDPAFMDLPPEVLTTVMRHHLKHFALVDRDGNLAPRFLVVANINANDGGKQIVAGNERVLRARLADAKFFWDNDRKRTLESRVPTVGEIIFHEELGTMSERVRRMQTLAAEIGASMRECDPEQARRAALLCKADLTTEMVGEFPELQGVMGRYYALEDGEPPEVAEAIAQHYAPLGPSDRCPTAPVSIAVSLADKIDTLVGFFGIGQKPTGSKDPYALRRAALGVIRLVLENEIRLGFLNFLGQANHLYAEAPSGVTWDAPGPNVLAFITDRLKVHLREKGVRHDLIGAVFALGHEDDLVRLLARVAALEEFLSSEDGEHLLVAYRRAANIVRIEEKRDGVRYDGAAVASALLREADEKAVAETLAEVSERSAAALDDEDFAAAMGALARLRAPVDAFFDNVTVNCDDADLRENRLRLLATIQATMNRVADFSKIEGGER